MQRTDTPATVGETAAAAAALANAALCADMRRLEGTVEKTVTMASAVVEFRRSLYQPTARRATQEFVRGVGGAVIDVDKVGPMGTTALLMVCTQGKLAEAQALVEVGGADVNLEGLEFVNMTVETKHVGQPASAWKRIMTPLMAAIGSCHSDQGHMAVVEYLMSNGADPNQARTDDGVTPLYMAARGGHTAIARLLLGKGADPNKARIDTGATPLFWALQSGYTELVQLLLDKGADPLKARKQQQQQPAISPQVLLAATTLADGINRIRESNPFKTSFDSLAAGAGTATAGVPIGGAKGEAAEHTRLPAGFTDSGAGAPAPAPAPAIAPALPSLSHGESNLGKAKRKGREGETAEEEEARTGSKRDRNRLAAKNCRQRKIDKETDLRAQLKGLESTHVQLLARVDKLTSEVSALQST